MTPKKLYIVTGKGGVGKTVTALALTKALQERTNKKVVYNCFDETSATDLSKKLKIKSLELPLSQSTIEYVARKLGSETIAKWIVSASFFKSLFNIVPSLGNMITLGHIIDKLNKDDDLVIVLDAPSSGHVLTVLESPKNFDAIFKSGKLVEDIHGMLDFVTDGDKVETWVINIPTELAITEGDELAEKLSKSGIKNIKKILNNTMTNSVYAKTKGLPKFLQQKLDNEKNVIANYADQFSTVLPMFIDSDPIELVLDIEDKLKKGFHI